MTKVHEIFNDSRLALSLIHNTCFVSRCFAGRCFVGLCLVGPCLVGLCLVGPCFVVLAFALCAYECGISFASFTLTQEIQYILLIPFNACYLHQNFSLLSKVIPF